MSHKPPVIAPYVDAFIKRHILRHRQVVIQNFTSGEGQRTTWLYNKGNLVLMLSNFQLSIYTYHLTEFTEALANGVLKAYDMGIHIHATDRYVYIQYDNGHTVKKDKGNIFSVFVPLKD